MPLAEHFFSSARVEIALQAADAVDEKFTIEMIDLMLQGDREQAFGFDFYFFFIFIDGADLHLGGALHFGGEVDYA